MKLTIFPRWLTQKLLNHIFMWEIHKTTGSHLCAFDIDVIKHDVWFVRHKIFRGCGIKLRFKPQKQDIPYYANDWLTKTKWINK